MEYMELRRDAIPRGLKELCGSDLVRGNKKEITRAQRTLV